ncbi:MAG: hypothetical protein IJ604_11085 [Prevotella sp.]|nr:hypothetical protein [Prevotella sp.]
MKKYYNIFTMLVIALVAGLSLTACSEDDLDTNQYQQGVHLNVYGPQPVMRGGMLRFLGSNLDQVASVTIPGVPPITSIEVIKSGIPSEIRVQVPKDGPEVGKVVLTTKTNETITTITELTYEEPIDFASFSPASAMPGEMITIEGDYLNLIHMVEFTDGVQVSENDFAYHDRYKIQVTVPETAKTGKISLYTVDLTNLEDPSADISYNIIESENALNVGTATVSKLASPRGEASAQGTVTVKQGETITITGSYFGLIEKVDVAGVEVTEFNVSGDGKTLSFVVPAAAPDGDVNLVCRSGVEVPVGKIETVAPSNCSVTPNPVKADGRMIIRGEDLDVVSEVLFDNVADAVEFSVTGVGIVINAVPETAQEGEGLTLRMANGKEVKVPFTLVKPVATAYNANPVAAGAVLIVTGTDLDLVKSITFGDATADVDEATADGKTLTIRIPMEGTSGVPVLNLANGTTVDAPELNIAEAVFCYITELPEFNEDNTPQAGDVFTVPVKNADKLTNVFVNNEEVKYVYSETAQTLTFGIPATASSSSTVKLVSSNGEVEYKISVIPQGSITKVIFNGPFELTWSTSTQGGIPVTALDDVPDGAEVSLIFNYTVTGADPKMKAYNGGWGHIDIATGLEPASETIYSFDPSSDKYIIPLSASAIANLKAGSTDWGGLLIVHGQDAILNSIAVEIKISFEKNIADYVKNMDGSAISYPYTFIWGDEGRFSLSPELLAELGVKKGSKFIVYKDPSVSGQVQINDTSWTALYYLTDWSEGKDVMELVFDDVVMEAINNGGLIIQGDISGITKIAILP